jgi:hypothetical protein
MHIFLQCEVTIEEGGDFPKNLSSFGVKGRQWAFKFNLLSLYLARGSISTLCYFLGC